MGELEDTSAANPTLRKASSLCEECKSKESKYKCPGCSVRSCSLPCVKAHKQRTSCSGKRPLTQFLPLSQFDDNVLLSDYKMLEDVKRVADSARRTRVELCGNFHHGLPFHLKNLGRAATNRRTKLMFLLSGMSKRQRNKTTYNARRKSISWTIEWRFHSTYTTLIDHGVDENSNFGSVVEKHLNPGPWSHPLKQFCVEPLETLRFFIRIYPKGPRSPFRELDIKAPIREQLANLVIIEYPVIYVLLPSQTCNFEVIKETISCKPKLKDPVKDGQSSPKGVFFKEEEIEDSFSDPQVLDLMKHMKPDRGLCRLSNPRPNRLMDKNLCNDGQQLSAKVASSISVIKEKECCHKAEADDFHWDPTNKKVRKVEPVSACQVSPNGVFFKEEEVEEYKSPAPQALDLTKDIKPEGGLSNPHPSTRVLEKTSNMFNGPQLPSEVEGSIPVINDQKCCRKAEDDFPWNHNSMEVGDVEDFDFGFDIGLMDGFSDLVTDTNPDDFFDLEKMLFEDELPKKSIDGIDSNGNPPAEEELEEGEIPGC